MRMPTSLATIQFISMAKWLVALQVAAMASALINRLHLP